MNTHRQLSDQEFETQFKKTTLAPELFTHEAHLRLAYIYIKKYGIKNAVPQVGQQLKAYVKFLGQEKKYNETLTFAGVRAVYHFMLSTKTNNFNAFIDENPRLRDNFKELISQHYQTDIFNSEATKNKYQEPELLPFD